MPPSVPPTKCRVAFMSGCSSDAGECAAGGVCAGGVSFTEAAAMSATGEAPEEAEAPEEHEALPFPCKPDPEAAAEGPTLPREDTNER